MDEQTNNKQEELDATTLGRINELEEANAIKIEKSEEEVREEEKDVLQEHNQEDIEAATGAEEKEEPPTNVLSSEEEGKVAELSRDELVQQLEQLYKEGILPASKSLVALLRVSYKEKTEEWKKTLKEKFTSEGGDEKQFSFVDTLETRFFEVSGKIREYHAKQREERERLMADNLGKKKALLEELRQLIDSDEPLKQTYDAFTKLTETWKEIRPIAREEANNLWQNYHFLVEKFFDKVKMNNELRLLDQKKNLEEKTLLCEQAEELLLEESVSKASQLLHGLHLRWKEIGQVSMEMKDEIWERFKSASDKISQKRQAYYDEMEAKMQQNLLAKTELCEKVEGMLTTMPSDAKSWNELSTEIDECMSLWKGIGRAPQQDNDAIWERFKKGIQSFFDAKKAFFQQIHDEQLNNYNIKVDLCVQAENIAEQRLDWKAATQDILKLQKQWKETGPVPHRLSDKIWKRFRLACDTFFNKKSANYEQNKGKEVENMALKEKLIEEVKLLTCESREQLVQLVQDIQRKWMEIGFVPVKEKERLYSEFRSAIDAKFNSLPQGKGDRRGLSGILSSIESAEDASKLSGREIQMVSKRIAQLKSDLQTWENNMGFLSTSKNADVLRRELERKMQKAKQEVALLEAKLRLITNKN